MEEMCTSAVGVQREEEWLKFIRNRGLRKGLVEDGTFEQRFEGWGHEDMVREGFHSQGTSDEEYLLGP